MRRLLLLLVIVLIAMAFSFTSQADTSPIPLLELNQTTYLLTQQVPIIIGGNTSNLTDYLLKIQYDGAEFVFNGELGVETLFDPRGEGIYTILLQERASRITVDSATFSAIDPDALESLQSEAYSGRLIALEKEAYGIGEPIRFMINYKTPDFTLRLLTPTTIYRFLGSPDGDIIYRATEPGEHELQFIADGHLVERRLFTVLEGEMSVSSSPEFIPFTNIRYSVKNSYGSPLPAEMTIRKNGNIIQSSIDLRERYQLDIRPRDRYFEQVRLNGLRFGEELDMGLEEVDPKRNMPGKEAVYALAIDPSRVDFTDGEITLIAPGNEVYKCVDYDFATQTCTGEQVKIADVQKGSLIRLLISPVDPLFTFVDSSVGCSCQYQQSPAANSGTISCNQYCAVTVDGPGTDAEAGFIETVVFQASLTVTPDATTISNGNHYGDFDHDQTQDNGNEVLIGTSTATATTTLTWTKSPLNSSGSTAFTNLDCDNWPTNCTNYDVYVSTSADFQAPGASKKAPTINITLTVLNVTWNYTAAGNLTVALNRPTNGNSSNSTFILFNYTPRTSATNLTNCSLYTNETSWTVKNTSTSVTNNASNALGYTFSSDGAYLWNVRCIDSDANDKFSPNNFTIYVDTIPPAINLEAPVNNSNETGSVVIFDYNVSDLLGGVSSCELYINGSLEESDATITEATTQSFTKSLQNGLYSWYVGCYDEASNYNVSETRSFLVNKTPVIWNNTWYESGNANCASTGSCNIDLEQQTDGGTNTRQMTIGTKALASLANATSDYLGGNGAHIGATATITFRAYFSQQTNGRPYVTWRLYSLHDNASQSLICLSGDDNTGGQQITGSGTFVEGTCSPGADVHLLSTDRLRLAITVFNDHPSQAAIVTHDWDVANSYIDIADLVTLGIFSVDLIAPNSSLSIMQGETFNMTCQASCIYGSCLNTLVYAQYNTSSTAWVNISSTGNLLLGAGETNPHALGNFTSGLALNSTNTTFLINGSLASVNNVRCLAETQHDSAIGSTTQQVIVDDSSPPNVTLVSPPDETNTSNTTIYLTYFVNDVSNIANCSLFINGTFNRTNQTPITNPGNNQFSVTSAPRAHDFNWTVSCTDTGGYTGSASETWDVHVDTVAPNITLNYPGPAALIGYGTISFNWTPYDNRPENLSCDLYTDGSVNISGIPSVPGSWINRTVSGFSIGLHNWSVTCRDAAGNTNSSETRTFNVTDTAPTVTLYAPPTNTYDGDAALLLEYNATDNNNLAACDLIFDGVFNQTNQTPVINDQINNFTLTGVAEGIHTWTVNCTDSSGFTDQPTAWNITVDTTPPLVTINSPNGTTLSSGDVDFRFTMTDALSPNATCNIQYNTSAATGSITGIIAQNGSVSSNVELGLADGIYTWNVTCLDLASNPYSTGLAPFNVSQNPGVVLNDPAPNAYANGAQVNFTFTPTDNDGFTNCSLRLLTGPNVSDTLNQSPIINGGLNSILLTGLASGFHTWSARCYDNGTFTNTFQPAARILIIDNQNPTVVQNYPLAQQVNSSNVTFNWTPDDDQDLTLSCNLFIDGSLNVSNILSPASDWRNYTVSNFSNGLHNWSVNCSDDAGNWNMTDTTNFTVFVPPTVELTYPDPYEFLSYYTGVTFEYVPSANSNITNCTLFVDGVQNETNSTIVEDGFNYFFIDFTPADEGGHNWTVSCTDEDGLAGGSPTNRTFYIDLTAPNIALHDPVPDALETWNNVTFNFTPYDNLAPNVTCNLTVDGFPERENIILPVNQSYSTGVLFPDGNYSWFVSCYDPAGWSNVSETRNFSILAPPNVTLLDPGNNSYLNYSTVDLIYLPEDGYPMDHCNLTLNGQFNETDPTIQTNQNNTFSLIGVAEGLYNWTVVCVDQDDNQYAPPVFWFTVDTTEPAIYLYDPAQNENFTVASLLFNFSAEDNLDENLTCNLTIDSSVSGINLSIVNNTPYANTLGPFSDGDHYWNASCWDDALNLNTSETRNYNINVTPLVILVDPNNDTWWSSSTLPFQFNVSDNDGFTNCTLLLNSSLSTSNATIVNNATNTITNSTMPEGIFNWTVICYDNGTYLNSYSPDEWLLYVDYTSPSILQHSPPNGSATSNNSIYFNFTVDDNLAFFLDCNLTIDGIVNETFSGVIPGTVLNTTVPDFSVGIHYWNVTCIDQAGNYNTSLTWNFTVPLPDLTINSGNITFNDSTQIEGENMTVFANVFNIGDSVASNFTVQFWLGDPDTTGVQIGNNITVLSLAAGANITLNITHTPVIGANDLYVLVDTPLISNGVISEPDETNNKAFNTFSVGLYNYFSGNTTNVLRVADNVSIAVWTWDILNATGSNILIADIDSSLTFQSFQALGRNTTDGVRAEDFSDLDVALGSTIYADNINTTWTFGGAPLDTKSYTLFGQNVNNVPIINSTNVTSFKTGILWDTADGGNDYDGSQDIVFITQINKSQTGSQGTYDFEARVPALLRDYAGGTSSVAFYTELR